MSPVEETKEQEDFIKPSTQLSVGQKVDVLVYGGSGTGKTQFAATFNAVGNVVFIDFDSGLKTVRGWKDVSYFTVLETLPKPSAYVSFMRLLPQLEKRIINGEFNTVCLDSLTTFSECVLNAVMYESGKLGQNPSFVEWGEQMRRIKSVIDRLLVLPCNIVVTAHEQFEKDELSGKVWCLPLVTGKLATRISLYFDEVYHLQVEANKDSSSYTMLTRPDRYYTAKSRIGFKDAYVPTNYKSIEEALK